MAMIVAVMSSGRWWRCNKAPHRTDSSTDCGTKGRAMSASSGSSNCSPAARANEPASNHPLNRIVWIGTSR